MIVGAGPAGSTAAIRLAGSGRSVLLIEQKKFPREKLCGEFISPECLEHFHELGLSSEIDRAGPTTVRETVFYSKNGRGLQIPTEWLGTSQSKAIGLSRSRLDELLVQRALESGADFRPETTGTSILANGKLEFIKLRSSNGVVETVNAGIVIDATGRNRSLWRAVESNGTVYRADHVAFKAHLTGAAIAPETCELYVYPDGYGGCVEVENGLYNLCFIVKAGAVKWLGNEPVRIWREVVLKNKRAKQALDSAVVSGDWLAVPITRLGVGKSAPMKGLLSVGDAASFIDPFTGSGIALALESSRLAADAVIQNRSFENIANAYGRKYEATLKRRMRFTSYIRVAGRAGWLADGLIWVLGRNEGLRKLAAAQTRVNDAED